MPKEIKIQKVEKPKQLAKNDVAFRDDIAKILRSYDEAKELRNPNAKGLEKIWNQCFEYEDTNELVKVNLYQIQVLVQRQYEEHFSQDKKRDERLEELMRDLKTCEPKERADKMAIYQSECERVRAERIQETKQIQSLVTTAKQLAQEYRDCALQQAYFLHVTQVQKFSMLMMAVIQQNVHQPDVLSRISMQMEDALSKLFGTIPKAKDV